MPSEVEKLRALLAEARAITQDSLDSNTTGFDEEFKVCRCDSCERYRSLIQRLDTALAEPVEDDVDRRYTDAQVASICVENTDVKTRLRDAERERDEARAEVERLRSLKPIGTYSLDWNHEQERKRLTAERDAARAEAAAYKRDFEAELRGNAELRRQYGARGDETMFDFHARVAREREEALAEVKRLRDALTCSENDFGHRCIRCDSEVEP